MVQLLESWRWHSVSAYLNLKNNSNFSDMIKLTVNLCDAQLCATIYTIILMGDPNIQNMNENKLN